MPKLKFSRLIVWLLVAADAGRSQSAPPSAPESVALSSASPITIGEKRTLHSRRLGEDRELWIATPASYGKGDTRYPVLMVLDGSENFLTVTSAVRALSGSGRMPEMIVVGVANTNRDRDFTPALKKTKELPFGIVQAGGADAFADFLDSEAIPALDRSYRTQPLRALVGHSLGGLLAMHLLASRPALFRMYLTVEPSLWWDAREQVTSLFETLRSHPELVARLAAAEGSSQDGWRRDWSRLQAVAPKGFHAEIISIDDELHQNLMYRSAYAGLLALFRDYVPASGHDVSLATLRSLEAQYARLSRDFGYALPIPLAPLLDLADREQNHRRFTTARAALDRAAQLYPGSSAVREWQSNLDSMIADARRRNLAEERNPLTFAPVSPSDARPFLGHWRSTANPTAPASDIEIRLAGDTLTLDLLARGVAADGGDLRFPKSIVEVHGRTMRFERENRGGGHIVSTVHLDADGVLRGSDEAIGGHPVPAGLVIPKTVLEYRRN